MSKVSHTSSSSSLVRRLIEETANRKDLEAKLKLLKEKQELAERKLQLQKIKEEEEFHFKQQEEMLKMKMELPRQLRGRKFMLKQRRRSVVNCLTLMKLKNRLRKLIII